MKGRFFGSYLVGRDLVRVEHVLAALELQSYRRIPISRIALREQKMSVRQVYATLNSQVENHLRFGEAAVQLGYIKPEDLDELRKIQQDEWSPIGEVLVEMGVLDRPTMEAALADFNPCLELYPPNSAILPVSAD